MANYLSRPHTYGNPIPQYDFSLLAKGLQYKQQQVDLNTEKIQNEIDQLANIDLIRDVDKQYFSEKLNAAVSQINSMQGANWSSASMPTMIRGQLRSVIDDKVVNAAMSTKSIRAAQSQIEQAKKDKVYATQNEYVAFLGMDEYLANPEAGVKYSAAGYTPYHDYNEEMKPYLENLQKYAPGVKKMYRDGEGYFVTEDNKILSPEQVRSVAQGLLSQKARTQLQIDGVYNYTRGENASILPEQFGAYKKRQFDYMDRIISNNQARIDAPNTPQSEKEQLIRENNELQARRTDDETRYAQLEKSPTQMAYILQQDNFLSSLGRQYQVNDTSYELSNDTSFWAKKNYELQVAKFEYQKQQDGNSGDGGIQRLVTPNDNVPDRNVVDEAYTTINTAQEGLAGFINGKLSQPDIAKAATTWETEYDNMSAQQRKGLTKEMYLADRMKQSGYLTIADKKELDTYVQTINYNTEALLTANDAVEQELEDEKLPKVIQELANSNRQMVDPATGRTVAMSDYLRRHGITPQNILSPSKSTQKKDILKSLHAEKIVAEESILGKAWEGLKGFVSNGVRLFSPTGAGLTGMDAEVAYLNEEERQTGKAKRRLARLNGEDFVSGKTPTTDTYLQQVRKSGIAGITVPGPLAATGLVGAVITGASRQQMAVPNLIASDDEYNKRLADRLPKANLQGTGNFAIPPNSPQFNEIMTAINGADPTTAGKINKDIALNARVNPSDPSQIFITQRQGNGDKMVVMQTPVYLQNLPKTASSLNFNNQRNLYTKETFKGVTEPIQILSTDDVNIIEDIAQNMYLPATGDINQAIVAAQQFNTKEGIQASLMGVYKNVLVNPDGTPTKYGQLVNTVLNDKGLAVDVKPVSSGISVALQKNGENLFTFANRIPYDQLQPTVEKAKYAPGETVFQMLNQVLQEKAAMGTENLFDKVVQKYTQR